MKIEINSRRKIFFVEKEFTDLFPNLRITFYAKPGSYGGAASKKIIRKDSKILGACRTVHHSGFITILPEMTAGELKQVFGDEYGLTIDIFQRNRGNSWATSPANKNATLRELNKEIAYAPPS
ncbi:hypothetical protein ACTHGU_00070 [Chitinophagaceae bacterium MMS25-I14]